MGNSISSIDYEQQLLDCRDFDYSRQVGDAEPSLGFGPIYRAKSSDELLDGFYPEGSKTSIKTMPELIAEGLKHAGAETHFLGQRIWKVAEKAIERTEAELKVLPKSYSPTGYSERKDGSVDRFEYAWITHGEAKEVIESFGRGVAALGIEKGSKAGIFAVNRPEWIITQYAYYSQSLTVVPLYATLGPNAIEYILQHSEVPIVVVSKENYNALAKALPALKASGDCKLKHIIVIDAICNNRWGNTLDQVTDKQKELVAGTDVQLHNMSDIIALGKTAEHAEKPLFAPEAQDLAFVMYTSGTTGSNPKGVLLTHQNVAAACGPCKIALGARLHAHNVYFSYLPLPHIFEQVVVSLLIATSARIAFSQGDVRQIVSDLQASKPSVMPGVPRIWSKLYSGAFSSIDQMGLIKRWYIYRAYNYQLNQLRTNQPLDPSYDTKVFKLLREKMGLDNISILITGAAPCPGYLVEFMRVMTNAFFSQGYGMTESSAATAISLQGDHLINHCGPLLPSADFRLASIPDMGYSYEDELPRGELLLSGHSVFKGYYKNQQDTDATLVKDASGRLWLRTGDVARYNKHIGTISIIDRKKSLLKLSQGEYVSLEAVENKYGQSQLVSQFWVYGNSYKSMLVAIVVPNVMPLYDLCLSNGWWKLVDKPVPGQLTDEIIAHFKSIVAEHRSEVQSWMKASLLPCESTLLGFEKIKAFHVCVDFDHLGLAMTDQNELLTPTMKIKRQACAKHFLPQLKELYERVGEPEQDGESWW